MKSVYQLQTSFLPVLGVPPISSLFPNLLLIQDSIWIPLHLVRAMLLSLKSQIGPLASSQNPSTALSKTLPLHLQPQLPAGSAHTLCNFQFLPCCLSSPPPLGTHPWCSWSEQCGGCQAYLHAELS